MEDAFSFLPLLLSLLPAYLLWAVGVVYAVVRWQRHPLVSALFVGSAVVETLTRTAATLLPVTLLRTGWSRTDIGWLFGVVNLIGLAGLAICIVAVFIDRRRADQA